MAAAAYELGLEIRDEILRGASIANSLQGFGRFWHTSPIDLRAEQRVKLWDNSERVPRIDFFISQAWNTPGWKKYISLLVKFYWKPASIIHTLAFAILFFGDILGFFPIIDGGSRSFVGRTVTIYVCPWGCIPSILGLFALFVAPELDRFCHRHPIVFFDALCINQVDEKLKEEGIHSLGGFLRHSDKMVVLWSSDYFCRCWCVYEIAAFVKYCGADNIDWCPVFLSCWQLFGCMAIALGLSVDNLFLAIGVHRLIRHAAGLTFAFVPVYIFIRTGRAFMRDKHRLKRQLAGFTTTEAKCREEADRQMIQSCVTSWFGSTSAFDDFVRGELKDKINSYSEFFGFSLQHCYIVCCPTFGVAAQWMIGYSRSELEFEAKVSLVSTQVCFPLFVAPLTCYAINAICKLFRERQTSFMRNEVVNVGLSIVLVACLFLFLAAALMVTGWIRLGGLLYVPLTLVPFAWVFRPRAMRSLFTECCSNSRTVLSTSTVESASPTTSDVTVEASGGLGEGESV